MDDTKAAAAVVPGSSGDHRAAPGKGHDPEEGKIGTLAGLPALSLDALTSVAYGPEAIVIVLAGSSLGAIRAVRPITVAIVVLLAILVFSYYQVIEAYPDGGGSYAVSKENLGTFPSLLAGASLIVDYVLTVAVSIASGVAALTSAFPSLTRQTVPICMVLLVLLTVLNLFGLAESAKAFAIPTLVFIGGLYVVVVVGLVHPLGPAAPRLPSPATVSSVGLLLALKAFASGCSALTGVEAIANGTPSFKEPRVKRAQGTEILLGLILGSLLLGLSQLTVDFHLRPKANVTLLSQITDRSIGHGAGFYIIELATTVALALAANTSFGGLPVLASLLARDNYLPRVFALHGERTVYRYGIVVLGALAGVLLLGSRGNTQSLLPLFAIGVFVGFTLAQTGLVIHWFRHRERFWQLRAVVNGVGAVLSAAAAVIFLITKFTHGAYIIMILIPALIGMMVAIHRYYDKLGSVLGLEAQPPRPDTVSPALFLVPVVGISRLTAAVLEHALATGSEVRAVHAAFEGEPTDDLVAAWGEWNPGAPLVVRPSPQRSVTQAFVDYLKEPEVAAHLNIVVLIGQIEPRKLRHRLLLNQRGTILASVLRVTTDAVVATLPFRLD